MDFVALFTLTFFHIVSSGYKLYMSWHSQQNVMYTVCYQPARFVVISSNSESSNKNHFCCQLICVSFRMLYHTYFAYQLEEISVSIHELL